MLKKGIRCSLLEGSIYQDEIFNNILFSFSFWERTDFLGIKGGTKSNYIDDELGFWDGLKSCE